MEDRDEGMQDDNAEFSTWKLSAIPEIIAVPIPAAPAIPTKGPQPDNSIQPRPMPKGINKIVDTIELIDKPPGADERAREVLIMEPGIDTAELEVPATKEAIP